MAEQALPVGLDGVVDRVPVPVLDHVRAVRQVAHRLQEQLAGVRRPAGEALRLRLQHEVGRAQQPARDRPAEGDLHAGQAVLRGVIDVAARDGQALRGLLMIDRRLHAVGVIAPGKVEVVRQELTGPGVLAHDGRLPGEKLRHQLPAEALERAAQAGVDRVAHVRKVVPVVDAVAPVVQAERRVERVCRAKLRPEPRHKAPLYALAAHVVVLRLVVQLIAHDGRVAAHVADQLADDALGVAQVVRIGDVHDLARAVAAGTGVRLGKYARVSPDHPGRHGVRGRADDHVDARAAHRVQHAVDMRKVEHARLGLQRAPGGFGDAHGVDARLAHHAHVLLQAVIGHVLIVIGDAKAQFLHGRCLLWRPL